MSQKRLCLAWFGLVMPWLWSWIKSSIVRPKKLVKMSKTTKLKNSYLNRLRWILKVIIKAISTSFFGVAILWLVLDDNQSITKPNQAKPSLFGDIYRCFWPMFLTETPKTHQKWFDGAKFLKVTLMCSGFLMVPFLDKFIKLKYASDYMCHWLLATFCLSPGTKACHSSLSVPW